MTIFEKIENAKNPEELFGKDFAQVKKTYRKFALQVHPDRAPAKMKAQAQKAVRKLNMLHDEAEKRNQLGIYGQTDKTPDAKPAAAPITVTLGKKKYTITERLYEGDVCELFDCSGNAILKIARNPRDNDLVQAEATALKALKSSDPKDSHYVLQLPQLVDSFAINTKGLRRQANVISKLDGQYYTLADVIKKYPSGIDYRDAVWMIRRGLMVLGYAHMHGFIHGAVTPEHLLIRPKDHGGMLLDWCYSVKEGGTVLAVAPKYKDYYPPEILAKKAVGCSSDIYMLAKCGIALLGGDPVFGGIPRWVPRQFSGLLKACLLGPAFRPYDAFELHAQFGDVMKKLVGKPEFRPFGM